jgi:hypothetical protein
MISMNVRRAPNVAVSEKDDRQQLGELVARRS